MLGNTNHHLSALKAPSQSEQFCKMRCKMQYKCTMHETQLDDSTPNACTLTLIFYTNTNDDKHTVNKKLVNINVCYWTGQQLNDFNYLNMGTYL